jgi:ferredoxin-NADP reductase
VQTLILPARDVVTATPRTRIITVDLNGHSFMFRAGQAVFASLAESTIKRPYSIACSPGQAERTKAIELLVQIDDHRAPDPHLERVSVGTLLRIEGPFGSFDVAPSLDRRHLLLIAGGTGIAPLRSIMWDRLDNDPAADLMVIYSARAPEEFAYLGELGALAAEGRIDLKVTVTRDSSGTWTGAHGRINQALITSAVKTLDTQCVVCGPAAFVADISALLGAAGVQPDRILTETYTA